MHFATHDPRHFAEDAAIWCVDYRRTNELLPKELRKVCEGEDINILTTEMLNRVATTLQDFDALARHDYQDYFEPHTIDERIDNQIWGLLPEDFTVDNGLLQALATQPLFQPREPPSLLSCRALHVGCRRYEGRKFGGSFIAHARRLLPGCLQPLTLAVELFLAYRHVLELDLQFLQALLRPLLLTPQLREPVCQPMPLLPPGLRRNRPMRSSLPGLKCLTRQAGWWVFHQSSPLRPVPMR